MTPYRRHYLRAAAPKFKARCVVAARNMAAHRQWSCWKLKLLFMFSDNHISSVGRLSRFAVWVLLFHNWQLLIAEIAGISATRVSWAENWWRAAQCRNGKSTSPTWIWCAWPHVACAVRRWWCVTSVEDRWLVWQKHSAWLEDDATVSTGCQPALHYSSQAELIPVTWPGSLQRSGW